MTINEAIKEHAYIVHHHGLRRGARSIEAVRLGIEALEAIKSCRQYPECPFSELLPGETKE